MKWLLPVPARTRITLAASLLKRRALGDADRRARKSSAEHIGPALRSEGRAHRIGNALENKAEARRTARAAPNGANVSIHCGNRAIKRGAAVRAARGQVALRGAKRVHAICGGRRGRFANGRGIGAVREGNARGDEQVSLSGPQSPRTRRPDTAYVAVRGLHVKFVGRAGVFDDEHADGVDRAASPFEQRVIGERTTTVLRSTTKRPPHRRAERTGCCDIWR